MNNKIINSYTQTFDLVINITISSKFLGFYEFINLAKTDKYLNYYTKIYINKNYYIIQTCKITKIIIPKTISFYNLDEIINNNYDNYYWYYIFNQKLNRDELAFYYSYFVYKYNSFYIYGGYSKDWLCVLFPDGFIKSFDTTQTNDENDIILKIKLYYSVTSYRGTKKINYWDSDIIFYNNKEKIIYPDFVNSKLLKKLVINKNIYKIGSFIKKLNL